ncbi:MAG: hypothetical protein K2X44_08960 [Magnetospirillum sp.]|nr:hypothetical protein [Magnetospirillum sp.]
MFGSDPIKNKRIENVVARLFFGAFTVYIITVFLYFIKVADENVYALWLLLPIAFAGTYMLQRFLVKAMDCDVWIQPTLIIDNGFIYIEITNYKNHSIYEPKLFMQVIETAENGVRYIHHVSCVSFSHIGPRKGKENFSIRNKLDDVAISKVLEHDRASLLVGLTYIHNFTNDRGLRSWNFERHLVIDACAAATTSETLPKSDALAAAYETVTDLFKAGLLDRAALSHFQTLCRIGDSSLRRQPDEPPHVRKP